MLLFYPLAVIRYSPSSPASRELPPLGEARRAVEDASPYGRAESRTDRRGDLRSPSSRPRAGRDPLIAPPVEITAPAALGSPSGGSCQAACHAPPLD